MSNTGRIMIDDNAVIRKFNRREYIELGLTEYWIKAKSVFSSDEALMKTLYLITIEQGTDLGSTLNLL